ncbi:putative CBL-interacting protein kinase 3 [Blattamonas nauphoetae]|uniref:CBL-interacting protein kinase 3 n=1 Tax=Blattamonas nauphoetae TaxID=2049346 RepID=A0ABQ9XHM4_9EUKA|nr:putative CBL-interacting protein kinase 3 [Blattamonas nauphoetae]
MSDSVKVPNGYSFVRTINSGGFGSVVEMMENSTDEHYAGKIIQYVTVKDKERIDREVNRLRKFNHPGIVGLKQVASMDNMKVIVMELGKQSLADIVKDYTSRQILMPRDVVYRVMVDVSSALNLMHNDSSGATAHGDVKMENILLFAGGHFKLCDLGAVESEDVSSTRSVMSQLYVSPERMESETGKATCSSDVWALGIVLHWLLFGEPPFKSKSLLKLGQEISSFRVSMIGSSCGDEERALLMRMLDPNPETRVTSSQLCSFGVFRCLVNTPSSLWRLNDANVANYQARIEAEQTKVLRLKMELMTATSRNTQLERELTELRTMQVRLPPPPPPPATCQAFYLPPPPAPPPARQETVRRSQIGAAAIELFDRRQWKVSGNVLSKAQQTFVSLVSFEFGAVVARLSLTIRKGPNNNFGVGLISSNLKHDALTTSFNRQRGGAGFELHPEGRFAMQNDKVTNEGSACLEGREGQRVVLEADGREGKRTWKLSQDGEIAPVYFTNIPVPFRFAVYIFKMNDAVEIESAEVVSEPQMVGGTVAVPMDE